MRTRLLALLALMAMATVPVHAAAEEEKEDKKLDFKINIALDTRLDGQVTAYSGSPEKDTEFGFAGKFITLVVDGAITENLTYAYRQRHFLQCYRLALSQIPFSQEFYPYSRKGCNRNRRVRI